MSRVSAVNRCDGCSAAMPSMSRANSPDWPALWCDSCDRRYRALWTLEYLSRLAVFMWMEAETQEQMWMVLEPDPEPRDLKSAEQYHRMWSLASAVDRGLFRLSWPAQRGEP